MWATLGERPPLKVRYVVNNARRAQELVASERSLAAYLWRYKSEADTQPQTVSTSAASIALSKDLKRRGWSFVGPTTVYAFMRAMGLVDDHVQGCVVRDEVERARATFRRPGRDG